MAIVLQLGHLFLQCSPDFHDRNRGLDRLISKTMMQTSETRKLAELRAKTDRQLLAFLSARLDRGLAEAGNSFIHGAQVEQEVRRLLPLLEYANPAEWRRLQTRLSELSEILDGYSLQHSAA
jgi:hypothetical protein